MKGMKLTGSKRLNYLLGEMGIFSPYQVIEHLPRKYDSYLPSSKDQLLHMADKQKIVVVGKAIESPKVMRFKGISKTQFYFRADVGLDFLVVAWNRPYLGKTIQVGETYTLQASYDSKNHSLNMLNMKKGIIPPEHSIVPIYSLPTDYPEHLFRDLVKRSLEEEKGRIYDVLPTFIKNKYRFIDREKAFNLYHFPSNEEDVRQGLRVLKYEEALLFSLKNQLIRKANKALVEGKRKTDHQKVTEFVSSLPYPLTKSQSQAVHEAIKDMDEPTLMYRLLQGDVGMGKTLVATILAYANFTRGMQTAFLAPTDSLARQHYENLKKTLEPFGLKAVLLVGALDHSDRKVVEEMISSGEADVIVGTHALFSASVEYAALGLAIIDEQHKFGVNQRNLLANKGDHADVYLMSATPIPRTLSLTLYGDLDVSTLSEFPSKERIVVTKVVRSSSSGVTKEIEKALKEDKRIFAVAPKIEGGEDDDSSVLRLYENYKLRYPGKVGLIHGKMDEIEKEAAMLAFSRGMTKILVATSVIEVGIDVKEASLMLIHEPSRFALSSLHQLRGRIGRDGTPATCLLLYDGNDQDELDKLHVLTATNDGFKIAEEDLRRRGPGEMSGTRQSGLPDLRFVNVITDFRMFEAARDDAAQILSGEISGCQALIKRAEKEKGDIGLA